jgi:thymidylate synthase (FAD)
MKIKLISITKPVDVDLKNYSPEEYTTYIARVSNPSNQTNLDTAPKLLKYCLDQGHYSVYDMVDFTIEITTSLAIAAQILRHRSANFQQFSQRYAEAEGFEVVELRLQGVKNKQGSAELYQNKENIKAVELHIIRSFELYNTLIKDGVSRETARFVLPTCTTTRLYVKNSIRNWLAYLNQRLHNHTQKEHRLIAEKVRDIMIVEFPVICGTFDNFKTAFDEKFM